MLQFGHTLEVVTEIAPDEKDWTWVLERPCGECGFDARSIELGVVAAMILDNAELRLMLDSDDPLYPNRVQDETAIAERYDEQDPVIVAGELVAAAMGPGSRSSRSPDT